MHGCSACRNPVPERPVPAAHRHDGPRGVGQEGGQAKIASGWPPSFDALSGHSLTPGSSMTRTVCKRLYRSNLPRARPSRRRSVPPSLPEPVSQSLNQRWRERPRCPAPRVTPGRRDGVVHAIVGRAACRCLRSTVRAGRTRRPRALCSCRDSAGQRSRRMHAANRSRAHPCSPGTARHTLGSRLLRLHHRAVRCWRRARRRQCSSLRFDPAGGRAFGH